MTRILLQNVSFKYEGSKNSIFEAIFWKRNAPGLIGILGPNGSGKTTLLRLLCGLIKPTSGKIAIDGQRVSGTKMTRKLCSYIPENAKLFLIGPTPRKDIARSCNDISVARAILEEHDLSHLADKKLYHLSEGQRRIIAIVSAFYSGKNILFLDEPTIGLDSKGRELLVSLSRKAVLDNRTVIISTNDPRMFHHFEEILILNNRSICMQGSPSDVLYYLEEKTGLLPNQTVRLIMQLEKILFRKLIHQTDILEFNRALQEKKIY